MKPRRKISYDEGSCFVFPLEGGGFARGVVARMNGKGAVFGYFFGPRLTAIEEANLDGLDPNKAILRGDFGDLGLLKGEWKIYGRVSNWNRSEWPIPPLIRVDDIAKRAWLRYIDDVSFSSIREEEVDPVLVDRYPYDRVMGYVAVEIRMAKLLE